MAERGRAGGHPTVVITPGGLSSADQVDPLLAGRRVELVFDPFDLTRIEVRVAGVPAGTAVPHRIGRHAHPKARPETPPDSAPAPTGIDYAAFLDTTHQAELAAGVNYAALTRTTNPSSGSELPEQLDLRTGAQAAPAATDTNTGADPDTARTDGDREVAS